MTSSVKTEGNFFLACGRIESIPYYFFYYKTQDGGKKLGMVMTEQTTIYEEKRNDAYMVQFNSFRNPKDLENWSWAVPSVFYKDESIYGYAIHVPEGSIKKEIDLSLPK